MKILALALTALTALVAPVAGAQTARIGDLTVRAGDVPRRIVGYGLVVGLDGTGDRSYGGSTNQTPTVMSIVNLLLHFGVRVPTDQLMPRNVAAVLVTAEASPYLHAGGRFEVQVSSLGDATSLRGGVLWITPMVTDPNQPPVATAQGPVLITSEDGSGRTSMYSVARRGNSGRLPDGGVLEVDWPTPPASATPKLVLRQPDLAVATHIVAAVNTAYGPGTATLTDPGAITLKTPKSHADSLYQFLAAVDTLSVLQAYPARIVINGRDGTVVTGGEVRVGPASVSHRGLTLKIGNAPAPTVAAATGNTAPPAVLTLSAGATVQDVAAGLHAAGATTGEIAAIFDALRSVGALTAEVTIQ